MKIALVQQPLVWENAPANRNLFQQKINEINTTVDLIVLPEMFSTGFSMKPKPIAESMDGKTVLWMQKIAADRNCALAGSLVICANNKFYNRFLFVHPDGTIDFYDKKHLFTLAGEHQEYEAGTYQKIIEFRGFRICTLVCYDLRFPVFARNVAHYDVLIYVANWPKPRINAWDTLLKARAIENMSYCIGVNRTGEDANKNVYCGHSQVIDYLGNSILMPQIADGVFVVDIDKKIMLETREKFGFLNDRDHFLLV